MSSGEERDEGLGETCSRLRPGKLKTQARRLHDTRVPYLCLSTSVSTVVSSGSDTIEGALDRLRCPRPVESWKWDTGPSQ